jgi:hypothetical protein
MSRASKILAFNNASANAVAKRSIDRSAKALREHAEHVKTLADTLDYLQNQIYA